MLVCYVRLACQTRVKVCCKNWKYLHIIIYFILQFLGSGTFGTNFICWNYYYLKTVKLIHQVYFNKLLLIVHLNEILREFRCFSSIDFTLIFTKMPHLLIKVSPAISSSKVDLKYKSVTFLPLTLWSSVKDIHLIRGWSFLIQQ